MQYLKMQISDEGCPIAMTSEQQGTTEEYIYIYIHLYIPNIYICYR